MPGRLIDGLRWIFRFSAADPGEPVGSRRLRMVRVRGPTIHGHGDAGKKSGAQRVPIQVAGHMVFPVLCGVSLQVGQRKVRWVMRCEARRRGLCIGQCIVFNPLFAWPRARRRPHGSAADSLGEPGTRLPGWPGPRCAPAMGHVEGVAAVGGRPRSPCGCSFLIGGACSKSPASIGFGAASNFCGPKVRRISAKVRQKV